MNDATTFEVMKISEMINADFAKKFEIINRNLRIHKVSSENIRILIYS